MSYSSQVAIDTLRSIAHGSITNSYAALGTPFDHAMRTICVTNDTDAPMLISDDGINDKFYIAKTSYKLYDLNTNRDGGNLQQFKFSVGTQIYIKYVSAPSTGSVFLECLYAKGE